MTDEENFGSRFLMLDPDSGETIQNIARQLRRAGISKGFTQGAIEELWSAQGVYIERVAYEAILAAKGGNDEHVQVKHVRNAANLLSSGRGGLMRSLEPIGGVLAGVGASRAITILVSEAERSTLSIAIMLLFLIVGLGILATGFGRSRTVRE